jgi:site-specific recombinase XerD
MDITSTAVIKLDGPAEIALTTAADAARGFIEQAKAPNTQRAYRADWRDFMTWCDVRGLAPLPATPETVTLYLADLAGRCRVATLTRRLSAVSQTHQMAGHESPTSAAAVRTVMAWHPEEQGDRTQHEGRDAHR